MRFIQVISLTLLIQGTAVTGGSPIPNSGANLDISCIGHAFSIPYEQLKQWIPEAIRIYGTDSSRFVASEFRVTVVPISDSSGPRIDTATHSPEHVLLQYDDYGNTSLVILARTGTEYSRRWESRPLLGAGWSKPDDLDFDGTTELVTRLVSGVNGQENVFLWHWVGDSLATLSPSGRVEGLSDFVGRVSMDSTKTGTRIVTSRTCNGEVVEATFMYAKGARTIQKVAERTLGKVQK